MDRKERLCALVPAARHYALLQHGILRAEATVIVIIRSSPHRHPFMDHFNLSSPSPSPAKTQANHQPGDPRIININLTHHLHVLDAHLPAAALGLVLDH